LETEAVTRIEKTVKAVSDLRDFYMKIHKRKDTARDAEANQPRRHIDDRRVDEDREGSTGKAS
jgi:hypothetical protein